MAMLARFIKEDWYGWVGGEWARRHMRRTVFCADCVGDE